MRTIDKKTMATLHPKNTSAQDITITFNDEYKPVLEKPAELTRQILHLWAYTCCSVSETDLRRQLILQALDIKEYFFDFIIWYMKMYASMDFTLLCTHEEQPTVDQKRFWIECAHFYKVQRVLFHNHIFLLGARCRASQES
jgi:hypothetical protein